MRKHEIFSKRKKRKEGEGREGRGRRRRRADIPVNGMLGRSEAKISP
jgi:hypothetical protein